MKSEHHGIISDKEYGLKLKWGDYIIFAVIAAAIVSMFVLSMPKEVSGALTAQIIKDGEVVYEVRLDEVEDTQTYSLDDGDVIIEAQTGKIRFLESDCPNQICVYTGWISNANQLSACIPNKILIKIVGTDEEVDVVVQ